MAFTAYIVYNSENILVGIYRTQAEANAASGKDASFTAYGQSVSIDDGMRLGVYFDTTDNSVKVEKPLSNDQLLLSRRNVLKIGIRTLQVYPEFATLAALDPDRGRVFVRRLESLGRAANIDTNVTSDTIYKVLLSDINIDAAEWYYQFNYTDWNAHYPDNRANSVWGSTYLFETLHESPFSNNNLDNSLYDSRLGISGTVSGRADAGRVVFSLVKFLREV